MNCLFAQFKGLSATGSRPFDATADGVVFSEGAYILALKRLPDAIAAGDRIHDLLSQKVAGFTNMKVKVAIFL